MLESGRFLALRSPALGAGNGPQCPFIHKLTHMPDEIVGGDTTEGTVPVSGDAVGSIDKAPVAPVEAGTAPAASASVELPEALRDKYVEAERYQNLESKLGNWSETEKNAALYEQLSQDPRVQAALQPQVEIAQPEQLPDFSAMQPNEVIEFMDKRNEQRASQIAEQAIEKFREQNLKPLEEATYNRQADEMVKGMETKYPDFKENRQAIAEFLDKNPAIAADMNENTLEMAYRYVTWEKQQSAGAKDAVRKLQTKAKDTASRPQGSAVTGKATPKSIADAWAQAEDMNAT